MASVAFLKSANLHPKSLNSCYFNNTLIPYIFRGINQKFAVTLAHHFIIIVFSEFFSHRILLFLTLPSL